MADRTARLIEELAEACWGLPAIRPDGTSESPTSEQAYFRKEEAAYKLKKHLEDLYRLEKDTEHELRHCTSHFRDGTKSVLMSTRKAIADAKQALARAAMKKFPREPRGPFGGRVGEPLPSTRELLSNEHKVRRLMEGK
jgi:hypothetical protein